MGSIRIQIAAVFFAVFRYVGPYTSLHRRLHSLIFGVIGTGHFDVQRLLYTGTLANDSEDEPSGLLSNAAINFSFVHSWLGKKTLLTRWGHVSVSPHSETAAQQAAMRQSSKRNSTGTKAASSPRSPSMSTSPDASTEQPTAEGDVGSFCAHLHQQIEFFCGELLRVQQDVEESAYLRALVRSLTICCLLTVMAFLSRH